MVSSITDPWGHPLSYRLISSSQARISSAGPDGVFLSPDDINDTIEIVPPESALDQQTWLFKRLKERDAKLGIGDASADSNESTVSKFTDRVTIGGGQTLEGSAQFWFFTYLMLGTAILFIHVSLIYRPKEYLQEESDHAEAVEEGVSA